MLNFKRYLITGVIALATGATAMSPALADGAFKPTGPVRIVVPFPFCPYGKSRGGKIIIL